MAVENRNAQDVEDRKPDSRQREVISIHNRARLRLKCWAPRTAKTETEGKLVDRHEKTGKYYAVVVTSYTAA